MNAANKRCQIHSVRLQAKMLRYVSTTHNLCQEPKRADHSALVELVVRHVERSARGAMRASGAEDHPRDRAQIGALLVINDAYLVVSARPRVILIMAVINNHKTLAEIREEEPPDSPANDFPYSTR